MTLLIDTIDLKSTGWLKTKLSQRASADVVNNKLTEGSYRTNNNGTITRTFTVTGMLVTGGGTTYLEKMSSLYDLLDATAKYYLTSDELVFDASNHVYVRMTDLDFEENTQTSSGYTVPFTIQFIEAIE